MLTLFYDSNCDFCKRVVDKIQSMSMNDLVTRTLQSVQPQEQIFANVSNVELMSQMWLWNYESKELLGGYFAFKYLVLESLDSKLLKVLFNLPAADKVGPVVYRFVARNRRLAGCNSGTCLIHE